MKKIVVLLVSFLFANAMSAQVTYKSYVKDCVFKLKEWDKMKTFEYINSHGEKASCSLDEMAALLRKDVIGYYGLGDKYDTDLKVSMYKKTDDYQDTYETMMEEYNYFTQGKGYLLFNLRYNSDYDVVKRCFIFKIGFDDLYRYSQPGYLCFEEGIALTYPAAYLSRNNRTSNLSTNGSYHDNLVKTTVIPEETALKIEDEMKNPYCNARLLLIFKLTNTTNEIRNVAGFRVSQNYIIGKTIGAYIVNEKTGEVYADMSNIFSKLMTNRKSTTQRKK